MFSGALEAQSAATGRGGNPTAMIIKAISSRAIGCAASFAMRSICINLDARTNSPPCIGGFRRAAPHQLLFAPVARKLRRRLESCACFVMAAELLQQIAANAGNR